MNDPHKKSRHHNKPRSVSLRSCLTGVTGLLASLAHSASPPEAAAMPTAPQEVYVDRVIEGLRPDNDPLQLKADDYNSSGWSRSWRVDYSVFSQKGATQTQSNAIGISGFLDTPNHGTLSVNSSTIEQQLESPSTQTQGRGTTWRLDQRSIPLDDGWRANLSAGDINTGIVNMGRINGRISIPSTQIRGVAGQWYQGDTVEINVAKGPAGIFHGLDVAGFDKLSGQLSSAGAQFRLPTDKSGNASSRSDAAMQVIEGREITSSSTGTTQDTRGLWMATAWEGVAPWSNGLAKGSGNPSDRTGGLRIQGNVIQSSSSIDGDAFGLWADAVWRTERWRQAAGIYRFEPFLRWGTSALASDLQGVYWQADTSTRQWQAGFSSEFSEALQKTAAGGSGKSAFFSGNVRYRLNSRNALGGTLNVKALAGSGQSMSLNWDRTGDWGQTQWRGDFANTVEGHTNRFSVDHGWPMAEPTTFSTSLAWERISGGGSSSGTGLIWGLLGTWSPQPRWSLDTSIRGARRSNGSQSLNANIGLVLQGQGGWSLSLRYTESRGKEPLQPLVVSALTTALQPIIQDTPANRSIQLILSYSARAGMASAPLGGLPGTGAGELSGTVFFDADANGKREASEGGVPNITVILDRRYVSRTDAQGKYSFPYVSAGPHRVEISSDNVPLPWNPVLRDPVKTEVLVRETTIQDFAVQKER